MLTKNDLPEKYAVENLKSQALQYLQENRPALLKELRESGELEKHLQHQAESLREALLPEAEKLQAQGWKEPKAALNQAFLLLSPDYLFPGMPSIA